jgi:hypothetical protein
MTQLILNAAASKCHDAIPLVMVDCDNNWVVSYGNEPLCPFPTNQSQKDIFCVFKNLISAQPFGARYKYVQSHADDTKRWQDFSLKERFNIKVDRLAKKALTAAHSTSECIESAFPNEQIWNLHWGEKVTGSLRSKLEEFWGGLPLRSFSTKKESAHLLIFTLSGG